MLWVLRLEGCRFWALAIKVDSRSESPSPSPYVVKPHTAGMNVYAGVYSASMHPLATS